MSISLTFKNICFKMYVMLKLILSLVISGYECLSPLCLVIISNFILMSFEESQRASDRVIFLVPQHIVDELLKACKVLGVVICVL